MSAKERKRLEVCARVERKELTLVSASLLLDLSYRQMQRVLMTYRSEGDAGLIHKGRGQVSHRKMDTGLYTQIIDLYKSSYAGWPAKHASEEMAAREGIVVAATTLRGMLIREGLLTRQRKRSPHRKRRLRKEHFGELLQMDGSYHQWFGEDSPLVYLMNLIDDATGVDMALMAAQESTWAAMDLYEAWVGVHGVPKAIYVDRKTVYITGREASLEEQLAGVEPATQFGHACKKLGTHLIPANSPQAKGRVERSHGTHQQRLVREFAREGITTIEQANAYLPQYLEKHNRLFAQMPAQPEDFHLTPPKAQDLRRIFCLEQPRVITYDWVVRYNNRHFQITKQGHLPRPKSTVTVQEWRDGSIHLEQGGQTIAFTEIGLKQVQSQRKEAQSQKEQAKVTPQSTLRFCKHYNQYLKQKHNPMPYDQRKRLEELAYEHGSEWLAEQAPGLPKRP